METNKYSYLFEQPNLKQGEEQEIFAAIKKGVDVKFNKERLFNAFFKKIYKEAAHIIKCNYHNDLDEALNHVTWFFYRGINTYDVNKKACFCTHIDYWIRCATLKAGMLRSDPELVEFDFSFEGGLGQTSDYDDCNSSAKNKQEIIKYAEDHCSGVNVIEEVERTDFLNQITNFLEKSKELNEGEKRAFIEYYGLDDVNFLTGKDAKTLGKKHKVSHQTIFNRKEKVEKQLKNFFLKEKKNLENYLS